MRPPVPGPARSSRSRTRAARHRRERTLAQRPQDRVIQPGDAKTGAAKGEIPIKDAKFLNDIAVASDGRVFVSDSSIKPGDKGFEPLGGDAVYVIDKAGKVKPLAQSKELKGPNGLVAVNGGVLVNTFLSDEIYRLDSEGAIKDVTKLPTGGLDGFLQVGESARPAGRREDLQGQARRQVRTGSPRERRGRHRLRLQAQPHDSAAFPRNGSSYAQVKA